MNGALQRLNGPPSTLHSKVAVGSLELELAPLFRNGDESGPE